MRKFFQKFKNDCKGAVTVFVTLLLIPSVLVSGFGVDIARLYTTHSEIRDANQLAANSALASYDALLQDLYGLFGIMKDDAELAAMMDTYVQTAVLGEEWMNQNPGDFSLFIGSKTQPCEVKGAPGKNLANTEILRRQIEEYSKFRAPAIIASEILDKLDTFEKIKEDAGVIKDKMEIEDKIEEIDEIYRKFYEAIGSVNEAVETENAADSAIQSFIGRIKSAVDTLYATRTSYTDAIKNGEEEQAEDYRRKYEAVFHNIGVLINGGRFNDGYLMGNYDDNGVYQYGGVRQTYMTKGLVDSLKKRIQELQGYDTNSDLRDNNSLAELQTIAGKADDKKEELSKKIDALEERLNSGKCSEDLREGMTVHKNANGKTYIEEYRALLGYQLRPMADAMRAKDKPQLEEAIRFLHDDIGYGEGGFGDPRFHALSWMADINQNQEGFEIDLVLQNEERDKNDQELLEDKLAFLHNLNPDRQEIPGTYEKFQSEAFKSTKNPEFYQQLKRIYEAEKQNNKKDKIQDGLDKLAGQIQSQFKSLLQFDPLGAYVYNNGADESDGANNSSFGDSGDWGSDGEAKKQTEEALNGNLLSRIADAGNSAAAKLLLLTYDSEMFSCYANNEGYSGDEAREPTEDNMAGIPLGVHVNYYFQSELEYLFNGNLADAKANLKAVTGMIFLVRFVLDYTASFAVSDVNATVNSVEAALAFLGPGAIVIGEMVRMLMALGEGVMDVSRLKSGCKVAVFKTSTTWTFSLSGILDQIADGIVGDLGSLTDSNKNDDEIGLIYKDYMRLFLLLVDGNTLAKRTSKLIELNVTNYRDDIGMLGSREARQNAMAAADLFRMDQAITDFSVTTTVNLKMMFLSSPVLQKGYLGSIPPHTKQVTVTDYRGY